MSEIEELDIESIEPVLEENIYKKSYTTRRDFRYDDDLSQGCNHDNIGTLPTLVDTDPDLQMKPNARFKSYKDIFENLTKYKKISTVFSIVSVMLSYDSTRAITVLKNDEKEYWIKMFSLQTNEQTFEEKVNGKYIKMKEVEQNATGKKYAICYLDDGLFRMRTFGKESRTKEEIAENQFEINEALGINDYTMPIAGFPDPYITCTFIDDENLFVCLFYNKTLTHYHFIYNDQEHKIVSEISKTVLDCTMKNFPYKCFFNNEDNQIYIFYRQGMAFTINASEPEQYVLENMTDMDLGDMYLINNKALIARSSSRILFFKIIQNEETLEKKWTHFHTLRIRGFIYFIKGNVRIQVTTDDKIYFFMIDQETFIPKLDNVMFNFMGCNQMMFGSKVKYGITYKTNQETFYIWTRKYMHDFRVSVAEENLEGSIGLEFSSMDAFLVSKVDKIVVYDAKNFKEIDTVPITLLVSVTREPNEIICMQKSDDQTLLGCISGKNLIKNEQKHNQLFIFKRMKKTDNGNGVKYQFVFHNKIVVKDIDLFTGVCPQFYFKNTSSGPIDSIIFAKKDSIFEMNFNNSQITLIYKFNQPLKLQPEFFNMDESQTIFVISSETDGIYYNSNTAEECDIDELYGITSIKEIIYDEQDCVFYILANKYEEKLGIFLIRFETQNIRKYVFMMKWKNKLDISDADLFIVRQQGLRELVISYKIIYINTYNVQLIDISNPEGRVEATLFRHEAFQLWESKVMGIILSKNFDFITFSKDGINVIALGQQEKRIVKDQQGNDRQIHSLQSVSFLKIEPENFILFECADANKIVSIYHEFTKHLKDGEETNFQKIYSIKLHSITLRELLLFQSLYVCKTQSEICNLVDNQPNPQVFYKSFLELDNTNMVSLLNFDSRSMKSLLDDRHAQYFSSEFPIFYKNKTVKINNNEEFYYRSALDSSLKTNQVGAVALMIEYIIKYQNNYVSSYLFLKNIPTIISKGIEVAPLFASNVFTETFDYDEWPGTHSDNQSYLRPFNHSIFELRHCYKEVFPEPEFDLIEEQEDSKSETSKVFKIKYSLNLLPAIGYYIKNDPKNGKIVCNEDVNLMSLTIDSDELDIFETDIVLQLIEFKWQQYARLHHLVGCCAHLMYLLTLIVYINMVYISNKGTQDTQRIYAYLLAFGIFYPAVYDWIQFGKSGPCDYFSDKWNYIDFLYIWSSIGNVYCQMFMGAFELLPKILMTIIIILALQKTFFFLRIFEELSPIVTMLTNVIYDLRIFLFFYSILVILFSLLLGVMGIGNKKVPGEFKDIYEFEDDDYPGVEYKFMGLFVGNLLVTLRMSMGDYDFSAATLLTKEQNIVYWIVWLLIVVITCIIFLNFIIAEASASYEKVSERLQAFILMQKANMISEAEEMRPYCFKNQDKFPKYIVNRQMEQ